ncbi:hypothetical protein [Streptomyces profundus]|uniref:hypothetical protein n=1 Tax=Streptomyces profundus TaxID=2867410 RepID=UPI001D16EBA2|nr:hypothetical protein [Streptomyces sp. MA3_2.13]UED85382.1 hypothetical protein K4G22_15230 [Streptomyces sp. MA3_2.13]
MGGQLHEHEELIKRVVPRQVGLDPHQNRGVRFEFPLGGPVLRVVGGRNTGKTALLGALFSNYNQRLPLARADLGAPDFGESVLSDLTGEAAENASATTHLLYLLSYRLASETTRFRRPLAFPRLRVGLLVITAWRTSADVSEGWRGVPADLRESEQELRDLLQQREPNRKKLNEAAQQWFVQVVDSLGFPMAGAAVEPLLRGVLSSVGGRPDRRALAWWRDQLEYQGSAVQRLFGMVGEFRERGEGRRAVELLLLRAFLADLAAHHGVVRRWNATPRPLVLLDNVHTTVGHHVLTLLLDAYQSLARAGHAAEAHFPVAFVTTALGSTEGLTSCAEAAGGASWQRPADGRAEDWLLSLAVPEVGPKEIGTMQRMRRAPGSAAFPRHLSRVIDRFAGTRPGSAALLLDAVATRAGRGEETPIEELLALPAEGETPVGERLARLLLPDPDVLRDLTLLAPALDTDSAARALRALGRPQPGNVEHDLDRRLKAVDAEQAGAHWRVRPWPWPVEEPGPARPVPLVGDRALRALLLWRLSVERGGETVVPVLGELRAAHNPDELPAGSAEHGLGYLHHSLTLGELAPAVRGLHHRLGRLAEPDWLAAVQVVCAAPPPPRGVRVWSDDADCPSCADAGGEVVHRAVGNLVRGVWAASDPLLPEPAPADLDRVRAALLTLTQHRDEDTLRTAFRQWPAALESGVQAPDLPIQRGEAPA